MPAWLQQQWQHGRQQAGSLGPLQRRLQLHSHRAGRRRAAGSVRSLLLGANRGICRSTMQVRHVLLWGPQSAG